jgi:DNA polymerase III alpha subunit
MQKLACYRSHYSLGSSVLTLGKPVGNLEKYPISIIDLVLNSKQDSLCLVENNMSSFLEAEKQCRENKIKLCFGLRIEICQDCLHQDEKSLKSRAKYIIFAKNNEGYKSLIRLWSFAAKEGFYYNPVIDFPNLKRLWNDSLLLAVPFYDSFLHLNSFEGNVHVPVFSGMQPIFFLEENGLPFDPYLRAKVLDYCEKNGYETVEAQSIYYYDRLSFIAYATFRCIHNRTTIEKPEINHFASDTFSYDHWLTENNKT